MWFKPGMVLGVFVWGCLALMAQSAPDQTQTPTQQQTAPTPGEQPDSKTQEQSPPAPSASEEQSQPPAGNQTATPQENETPRDANVPVLKHRPKKSTGKKATGSQSGKVVVRNGGAREGTPELAPGSSKEQEQHKRENTNQLLATTDANLKRTAGRQLTPAQKSMMEEIRTYVAQSRAAARAGDLDRAHTLAYKAHLLSDELAKK
jgi:hypothetical protein